MEQQCIIELLRIGMANWLERKYITEFERILKESQITVVFTIGNIADKNICYLEIAKSHGIKVVSKILCKTSSVQKFMPIILMDRA